MEMMLEQLLDLYREYQTHAHVGGGVVVVTLCAWAIAKLDKAKMFVVGEKPGMLFDKTMMFKLPFIVKYFEAALVQGILPLFVGFTYGMVKNCETMKLKLKDTLKWLSEKI